MSFTVGMHAAVDGREGGHGYAYSSGPMVIEQGERDGDRDQHAPGGESHGRVGHWEDDLPDG
jgi:hypothetical protein